ncbi:DUF7312 domain-containing protein [Halobaculum sp. D14]|uniref:DUF7312 domain-containing protein n=1 Tax=Halobaculum sp. D14 TaxID=3421642 RepID=UPI003EBE273A
MSERRDDRDDDGDWRFSVEDVGENGIVGREPEPIEPESISAENAVFVAVGVLGTLLLFASATLL